MDILELGTRLKMYRLAHEMTQYELSLTLHMTRQTISTYETGTRMPDIFTLWDIADIFDMSVDELIGRDFKSPIKPKQ